MQTKVPSPFNRWFYLLVLLAGALTVFAFAPFNVYPLAWITPGILFYALTKANTRKQHFLLGWLFGIGLFGLGASWPFYSMYFFANAPLMLAIIGTVLFVTVIAFLTIGLFGFLTSLFQDKSVFIRLLLLYPATWVLVEWYRGWFLTGFPWLYIGNSQIDTFISGYAPIAGVLGVSFICVIISGALVNFFVSNSQRPIAKINSENPDLNVKTQSDSEEPLGFSFKVLSPIIVIIVICIGYILQSHEWTTKTGKALTVSVLQSNISQLEKLNIDNLDSSIKLYMEMTKQSHHSDLIVWPETGLFDAYIHHMDDVILPLQKSIKKNNKSILIGGFNVNENNEVENSVLAISNSNRQVYSKRHLVPFGEYIPLLDYIRWLGKWIQLPYSNLVAGKSDGTLKVAGQKAQMTICYEDAFGAEVIQSLPDATMLINVTHDGWFTGSLEPEQHMQIARMRSLETGRYMVRATTTGPSGIINQKGKVMVTAPSYTKKIITGELQPFNGTTPYVRWGNWFIVSILMVIFLLGFHKRKST